jgi:hypothetical protein
MKVKTLSALQDAIDGQFAWRLKEIASLKTGVKQSGALGAPTLIRAGLALLYAHWEGFVKASALAYLEFVSSRGLLYRELQSCFVVLGMKGQLHTLEKSRKAEGLIAAYEFVARQQNEKAVLILANAVDTESNLSSIVFANILRSIGIDISGYEARFNLIDESLLKRRNKIAHGEFLDITADDWRELADEVISMLRHFKTDLENAASLECYKVAA